MQINKLRQEDLNSGDIVLLNSGCHFRLAKIERITKSGSVRYSYNPGTSSSGDYYDFDLDVTKLTKTGYISAPWKPVYSRYVLLLERLNGERNNQ